MRKSHHFAKPTRIGAGHLRKKLPPEDPEFANDIDSAKMKERMEHIPNTKKHW